MPITPEQFEQMQIRLHGKNRPAPTPPPSDPVTDESVLHNEIIQYCEENGWAYLHGAMSTRTSRTLGEPDFQIYCPNGSFLIECKSKTGKPSPAQLAFAALARRNGHTVYLVRSLEQFKIVVNKVPSYEIFALVPIS